MKTLLNKKGKQTLKPKKPLSQYDINLQRAAKLYPNGLRSGMPAAGNHFNAPAKHRSELDKKENQ